MGLDKEVVIRSQFLALDTHVEADWHIFLMAEWITMEYLDSSIYI